MHSNDIANIRGERMKAGILGYGLYVPFHRISGDQYKKAWGNFSAPGIKEKTVIGYDEDIITIGLESAQEAIEISGIDINDIQALYLATTSAPYIEKSASSMLAVALKGGEDIRTADFTASPRACSSALLAALDMSVAQKDSCSIMVASDAPLAAPDSNLDHSNGAAAASLIIGTRDPIAVLEGSYSVAKETLGERFRRSGDRYTSDLELRISFVKEGIQDSVKGLLSKLNKKPDEFHKVAYYQPDGRSVSRALAGLGFKKEQLAMGEIASVLGNVGAASAILSLTKVLGQAKPGERILLASYGFGGDAISLVVQDGIKSYQQKARSFDKALEDKKYIDYIDYLKMRRFLSSITD